MGLLMATGCSAGGSSTSELGTNGVAPTSTTTTNGATTGSPAPPPTTAPATTTILPLPPIRDIDLTSVTYRIDCPNGDGIEITPADGPTSTPDGGAQLESDLSAVYGDLTGDGTDDALVHLVCTFSDGGNAFVSSVALVVSEVGGPRQLGDAIDGYEPTTVGDLASIARAEFSPDDARCCPSTTRYVPVRFDGTNLVEGSDGGDPVGSSSKVTTGGIAGLRPGSTYGEAAAATGQIVVSTFEPEIGSECGSVGVEGAPEGISGLGDPERLQSVYIDHEAIKTTSGLGIGSTEADVYDALGDGVTSEPHEYQQGGHYLIFTSVDDPDQLIVFDTDGSSVTAYRVGTPGWADAIEGCL